MNNPDLIPGKIKGVLKQIGFWDLNPLNLFRIYWKNEPKEHGGLFGPVNYLEIPKHISGVKAVIIALVGKGFPTGTPVGDQEQSGGDQGPPVGKKKSS